MSKVFAIFLVSLLSFANFAHGKNCTKDDYVYLLERGYSAQDIMQLCQKSESSPEFYSVTQVPSWDVLYIRTGPGVKFSPVGSIPSDGTRIRKLGPEEKVTRSLWFYVSYGDTIGWVNSKYLKPEW